MKNDIFDGTSIPKAYFKFSLPIVFSMVVSVVYNLADTFFISQTGNTNLVAGVSLCAPVLTFIMAFGNIYGQGGSSLISRLLGMEKGEQVKKISSFCFYAAIATGLLLTVLLLLFQIPVLKLLGATTHTISYAHDYYIVLAFGSVFNILNFVQTNFLRSEGFATDSMIASVGGSIVNIVLDPIFISAMHMEAKGAAIATVLGYLFTDFYCLFVVLKKCRFLSIAPKQIQIPVNQICQIFIIGITAAITNIAQSICLILTNQALLPYGNTHIAAMGIVMKIILIASLILVAFSFGPAPLLGYLLGSGDKVQLKKLLKFCFGFQFSLGLFLTLIIFTQSNFLMSCFLQDSAVITTGVLMIRCQVVTIVLAGFITQMTVLFQSAGKATGSFLLSLSRQGIIFIIVLFIAKHLFGYTGILCAQAAADIFSTLLAIVLYKKYF